MAHESFDRRDEIHRSSNRALGLVFGTVFLIIGVWPWFHGGPSRLWSLVVCGAFVATALALPNVLTPLNRVWTRIGLFLHKIVSPVVLGIMFFAVIAPMGLMMRWLGKDPLRLRLDREAASYWQERNPPGPKPDTLSDQF
jgi:hypothetical protein